MHKFLMALCLLAMPATLIAETYTNKRAEHYEKFTHTNIAAMKVQTLKGENIFFMDVMDPDRPTLINVWATWCAACIEEMPDLLKLHQQGEFQVVLISGDLSLKLVERFLRKYPQFEAMTVLFDRLGMKTRRSLGAFEYPVSYLVDTKGIVRSVHVGPRPWHEAETVAMLKDILKKVPE